MPRKYEIIDELIRYELRQFLLWLQEKKEIELCRLEEPNEDFHAYNYFPIHKAPEALIDEYMEIE